LRQTAKLIRSHNSSAPRAELPRAYFSKGYPHTKLGCTVDYYPEERVPFEWNGRKYIIGDFAAVEEANAAIEARLREITSAKRAKRRRA
jgi:hypothetical protein